jgi:glycosyltransferase involved in cell wall biosynthesis
MFVTVAICTRHRSALLHSTLKQMTRLRIPPEVDWELLVVDNDSTHSTARVAREFDRQLPLRLLTESRPGKSHALNLAAREARGDYILWTDDDVLVEDGWLEAYVTAFRRWPESALFGGPIEPDLEGEPPAWLRQVWTRVSGAYAVLTADEGRVELGVGPGPFGANMAVRTEEQRRFRYDPSYGPQPGSPIRGEETAVAQAMLAAGIVGHWVPEARVRHFIPKERQTIRYLRETFFGLGLFDGLCRDYSDHPKLFGRPRWLWRQAVEGELRYRLGRILRKPELWVEGLIWSGFARGILRGYRQQHDG